MYNNTTTIISANYRDRKSEDKWLVRASNEDPHTGYETCRYVQAFDARFQRSSDYEQGFGCAMVASAKVASWTSSADLSAVIPGPGSAFRRLRFNGASFEDAETSDYVAYAKELKLLPDGSMWYRE